MQFPPNVNGRYSWTEKDYNQSYFSLFDIQYYEYSKNDEDEKIHLLCDIFPKSLGEIIDSYTTAITLKGDYSGWSYVRRELFLSQFYSCVIFKNIEKPSSKKFDLYDKFQISISGKWYNFKDTPYYFPELQ